MSSKSKHTVAEPVAPTTTQKQIGLQPVYMMLYKLVRIQTWPPQRVDSAATSLVKPLFISKRQRNPSKYFFPEA